MSRIGCGEIRDDPTVPDSGSRVGALLADDLAGLEPLEREGFGAGSGAGWDVSSAGRLIVRNAAAALDPCLRGGRALPTFSSSV